MKYRITYSEIVRYAPIDIEANSKEEAESKFFTTFAKRVAVEEILVDELKIEKNQ